MQSITEKVSILENLKALLYNKWGFKMVNKCH